MRRAGTDDFAEPHMAQDASTAAPEPLSSEDWEVWRRQYEAQRRRVPPHAVDRPPPGRAERRAHPRLTFPAGSRVHVHRGPTAHPVKNISVNGIAFYSEHRVPLGSRLRLSALGMLAVEVDVVGCEMELVHEAMMEYRYVVRGRFASNVNGYQIFILAREIQRDLDQPEEGGRGVPAARATPPEQS